MQNRRGIINFLLSITKQNGCGRRMSKDPTDTTSSEAILARLLEATGSKNEAALGTVIGITHQAVSNAKKKGSIPPAWVLEIARRFGVSADWLFFGSRNNKVMNSEKPGSAEFLSELGPHSLSVHYKDVPVIGLATCGLSGWYNTGPVALSCPIPIEYASPGVFAVIAIGTSMQPEGIKQGYVALCDPEAPLNEKDAIFVERKDGAAGIKLYLGQDDKWLNLQGWLEPKEDGTQKPYTEQLLRTSVEKVAVVVMVRRRA